MPLDFTPRTMLHSLHNSGKQFGSEQDIIETLSYHAYSASEINANIDKLSALHGVGAVPPLFTSAR